ncbi:S9 family peptidase [Pedobacter xixiisoli]|uniref:Dipeptidyl aminopeptidase/acylaminoacyl peptidase n=1 Tax=Pedobacter xixiisoli TaxID=1476464 RepID=A0A286ACY7_9SPHI|nr:S9 family peptidase [Pedobacter xixiisoli]SOD19762.1 Dipeptidyl aminopeptidase/acylaminoacyl peptidase [Pedobacter xixiisoli]
MKKQLLTIGTILTFFTLKAQNEPLTEQDYARAEQFLGYHIEPFVDEGAGMPFWVGTQFWYLSKTDKGNQFLLVNPAKKTKQPLFNHQQLAVELSKATNKTQEATKLPFQTLVYSTHALTVAFYAEGQSWSYDIKTNALTESKTNKTEPVRGRMMSGTIETVSPDGKKAVFIKDWNLWVKDIVSKKEMQLTFDGVKDYGYATDNAGWTNSARAIVKWSADSKKIATYQQDERHLKDMYLVTTNVGSPTLKAWKYPLPGDKEIAKLRRVVIDVENAKVVSLQIPLDEHRSSLSDDIKDGGQLADVDWNADGSEFAFLSTSRDHKVSKLQIANATTGAVREVFTETVKTHFESGVRSINWRYLPKTDEILWYSERDNWGHLYLYDAKTGKVKNQITKGNWLVGRLLKVDEKNRTLYFTGYGREQGNPYFSYLYKIGFDGKGLALLTPDLCNHQVSFSPDFKYMVDTYSQPNVPSITVLRDINGKKIEELGRTDISRLQAKGWKAPDVVKLLAADGKTDIYGLVFTPTQMKAGKKYPVVDYIYPGPQGGSVGNWSFSAFRSDHQALAELGFIVVLIEGTSNPMRSKSYHDMNYGNMGENTLPDQITAIKQLSEKYPIDIDKVGIWGHSGGGFATAAALFRYPEFFKVGVSQAGNHDNRNYEDDWGERYNGLLENSDYEAQANQTHAKNLKGKLMLAHGMMDNNVPPYNVYLVIDALNKANKDYDLVLFPHSSHGFGAYNPYMMRRRWDYFVKHLKGVATPREYNLRGANQEQK